MTALAMVQCCCCSVNLSASFLSDQVWSEWVGALVVWLKTSILSVKWDIMKSFLYTRLKLFCALKMSTSYLWITEYSEVLSEWLFGWTWFLFRICIFEALRWTFEPIDCQQHLRITHLSVRHLCIHIRFVSELFVSELKCTSYTATTKRLKISIWKIPDWNRNRSRSKCLLIWAAPWFTVK